MAAISQISTSFRVPPAFIPYSGPPVPKPKPKKRAVQREEALARRQPSPSENWMDIDDIFSSIGETTTVDASAENLSPASGNEISADAPRVNCGDNQENPIEIGSDTDEDTDSSGEDEDDDLPPVSVLLRRPARPRSEDVADEPQQANVATRRSSTRRSPTSSNDHNAYTAGAEAGGDGADDRSQGDLGKADEADGADGARDARPSQSAAFLDANHENRKRRQEPDGSLSNKRTKLAQQPDAVPPAKCVFSSQQSHGSHSARDYDDEDGTEDHGRPHHPQAIRANSCPSKQWRTTQALSHTDPTIDYPHLNTRGTSPTSLDEIAGMSRRGGGSEVGAIADLHHADSEITMPADSTNRADKSRNVNDNANEDAARLRLDGVDNQQDALLQYADATAPHKPLEDHINTPNDGSVSHRPSPALNSSNKQDAAAVGDWPVVSMYQASGSNDKDNDIDRDGQEVHHPQNDRGPQQSLSSDGKDGRVRRRRPRRRSSYSVRRAPREGERVHWISRRAKQTRTARLSGSDDSGDELERPASCRLSRQPRRQRADTLVSQDGNKRHVAGQRLHEPLNRHSNDPDPAGLHLEVGHDGKMQLDDSDKSPQTAPARVTGITRVTIRPVSRDASVLIALGGGDVVPMRYDDGVESTIKEAVGHAIKLASISIDPFPPGAWLLTGLICGLDEDGDVRTSDGQVTEQAAQARERASQSALRPRPRPQNSKVRSDTECQRPSGSDGDRASDASSNWQECSQERGENGEIGESDEESDGLGYSGWRSRHIKGSKWAESEDEHLREWVTQGARPRWKTIYQRFPKRTDASVYVRGHKIRSEEMAKRKKQWR